MATDQVPLSLVSWKQDGILQVKVEDKETNLSQIQECGLGNTVHPEAVRLSFQHFFYEEPSNPREALTQLHKLCCQWLQPEVHSKEQMLDLLVVEQFLGVLPPKIQAWVGAQCPKSGKEAAMLVEDLTQVLDKRDEETEARQGQDCPGPRIFPVAMLVPHWGLATVTLFTLFFLGSVWELVPCAPIKCRLHLHCKHNPVSSCP